MYGRHSIDAANLPLEAGVPYRRSYNNAFWDGERMVFGNGQVFNDFTISHDIVAHELTHAVAQFTAGLVCQEQSGALNESVSEVFGSLVKQFARRQSACSAVWPISAEVRLAVRRCRPSGMSSARLSRTEPAAGVRTRRAVPPCP